MKLLRNRIAPFVFVLLLGFIVLGACGSDATMLEELENSNLVEQSWSGEGSADENLRPASAFLVDLSGVEEYRFDYILGNEEFYFNNLFFQTRWNAMVDEINWSFGGGVEAYEYIRDNYDELQELLLDQLRSEIVVTFLASHLGFVADELELYAIWDDMDGFLMDARVEGVDVDAIFLETFGTTQENWMLQVERQLASIAMIDALWDENPPTEAMIQMLIDDIPADELPVMAEVYHILVDDEAVAQTIYEKIKEGVHPRDLHEEFSQDPGGPHYIFPRGMMVAPFEEWAFQAEAGDVGIITTQFGFHVSLSYGKELFTEELEHLARLHYLDIHIIELIRSLDIRWESQPGDSWVPQR